MKFHFFRIIFLFFMGGSLSAQSLGVLNAGPDVYLDTADCITLRGYFDPAGIEVATGSYRIDSLINPIWEVPDSFSILTALDDSWSDVIDLPFNFSFFGGAYNQYIIGENGVISFDMTSYGQSPQGYCDWQIDASKALPSQNTFKNTIFGAYHDLNTPSGGEIGYAVSGQAPFRKITVKYENIPHYSCNDLYTTQYIILHETSNIVDVVIRHKDTCSNWNHGWAILGIQNATGDTAYPVPGKNVAKWAVDTTTVWRFIPEGDSIPFRTQFTWYDRNDNAIGHDLELNVCVEQSTFFRLEAEIYSPASGNTYYASDTINIFVNPRTEVEKNQLKNMVEIFPNPAEKDITIRFRYSISPAIIQLISPAGMIIEEKNVIGNETILHFDDLPRGIYFILIHSATGNGIFSVIKK